MKQKPNALLSKAVRSRWLPLVSYLAVYFVTLILHWWLDIGRSVPAIAVVLAALVGMWFANRDFKRMVKDNEEWWGRTKQMLEWEQASRVQVNPQTWYCPNCRALVPPPSLIKTDE